MKIKKISLAQKLLMLLLFAAGSCAEEGDIQQSSLDVWTSYRKTQGLAGNEVLALHQQPDGPLWIGTSEGVSKMEGTKFTNYTVASTQGGLLSNRINAIISTTFGEIWFGTQGGLSFLKGTTWTNLPRINGLTYGVYALWQDSNKIVWIGTTNRGLLWYDGKSLFQYLDPGCSACNEIGSLFQDSKKNLWIGSGGALKQLPEAKPTNQLKVFTTANGLSGNYVTAMSEDEWGNIWFGTLQGKTISKYSGGKFSKISLANSNDENWITAILTDRKNNLWIATATAGLYRYDGAFMRKQMTSLPENYMGPLLQDREGNILIGTYTKGLVIYKPN